MIRFPKEQLVRHRHQGAGLLVVAYERQLKTIKSMSEKIHSIELENSKAWERVEQLEKQIKNYNERLQLIKKEQPMKHKYGVEYETNGEKPDLPDDVLVQVYTLDPPCGWGQCANVEHWNWMSGVISKFRIVDERYKPKEQDMNNWYEKGELPPVGEVCILASVGFTELNHEVEITYIGDGVGCYRLLKNNQEYTVNLGDAKFRPIHTETDEVVEQMCNDAIIGRDKDVKLNPVIVAAIERLAEQGYRKIKPMSEQEFMKQCVDICGHGSTLLYRAGCRFIDVCDERKLTESD